MRRAGFAAVIVILLVLVPSVGASSAPGAPHPGAAGIGDPYFPQDGNGGYDVQHYAIDVGYRPSTDVLTGRTTIRATATETLSRFNLDLVGLHVDSVRVDGSAASWSRTAHELKVTPRKALKAGHGFVVVVTYHGVPQPFDEVTLGLSGFFATADGNVLAGQPHGAASWFPVNDHPLDKATYEIAVTVPKGLEAVANGYLASKKVHGSTTTWTWRLDKPMASYLATMNTGHFRTKAYSASGISFFDAIDPALFANPAPVTGRQYAVSGAQDSGYLRLARTIAVPAGGGHLSFQVARNTEPGWDYFIVEARRAGTSSWTTLPDLNGHTSTDTGASCPSWLDIHPLLGHYESDNGDGTCSPSGTTGKWNAANGASDDYESWSVDLSAYAGHSVQVSLSVVSDDSVAFAGAWVDDIVGPGGSSTSFENDGNTMDGWAVPGAPTSSPGNEGDWTIATSDPRPSIGQRARDALDREPEILAFLASYLGPYPFKQAGGIVDNDPGLGFALETQTRPVYSKDFFQYGDVADNDSVVTHELAHQWTGDSLALGRWQDIWLNEGFASYMEWLWSEDQGRGTAQEIYDGITSIPADDPFWELTIGDPGPDALFDGAVYDRGAMTLHALRLKIGDPAFFRLLKKWTSTYAGGNVTTPQFIALAEHVSGKNLRGFFKEWLFTGARPASLPEPTLQRGSLQLEQKASSSRRWVEHLRR